ncbi:MAG TPA: class I SAM-dependent methyltransferase [Planctomycetaceae bacterium]|jgi:SAM-dependent methyltransferase|nr:class I SAM-dependent methyltransferase [Planctomycetaceae bacterium]
MSTLTPSDWDQRYVAGELPWDSGVPSKELIRVLDTEGIEPCRAVELGCGTGTNAIYLASRGFDVTGFDCSSTALEQARSKAARAGVDVDLRQADLCRFQLELEPFDFIFDRGCYHSVRRLDMAGFLKTLRRLSRPGTRYLLLAGNANEQGPGPPRVHEHEIRIDLEGLFEIQFIREFRFDVIDPPEGFLAWSCLMTRRPQ